MIATSEDIPGSFKLERESACLLLPKYCDNQVKTYRNKSDILCETDLREFYEWQIKKMK
jgi:hypothetical protein